MSYEIKTLRKDRTAAEWNDIADATRRRRRISQARFFFTSAGVSDSEARKRAGALEGEMQRIPGN